jgi:hypothetical protein
MQCPACQAATEPGATECRSCGIVLGRWRPRTERPPTLTRTALPKKSAPATAPRMARVLVLGLLGGAVVVGAFWYLRTGRLPTFPRVMRVRALDAVQAPFDRAYQLPGSPQGIASDGTDLVVGNRSDPWGAMRVGRLAGVWSARRVVITEPVYDQKLSLYTFVWNGTNYVGITTAAWFRRGAESSVFTVHDPRTLEVLSHRDAPPQLGCLAWDGAHYWAATRRNTRDEDVPALLYKLDRGFRVVATSPAPAVGCQGLAWDGRHLWLGDVFSDALFVLDVADGLPRVVNRIELPLQYLSGLAFHEGQLWVVDYGENRLQRVRPDLRTAWTGGFDRPAPVAAAAAAVPARAPAPAAVLQARRETMAPDRGAEAMDLVSWSIEIRGGVLYGTWALWFGPDLFVRREPPPNVIALPQLARYELTIRRPDGTKIEKEFDATPGENAMHDVVLSDAVLPGAYSVSMFLHVQYGGADGGGRVLNRSVASLEVQR